MFHYEKDLDDVFGNMNYIHVDMTLSVSYVQWLSLPHLKISESGTKIFWSIQMFIGPVQGNIDIVSYVHCPWELPMFIISISLGRK